MFVSDEADRNNGQRAAEPASECHNTANDDVELDCPSLFFFSHVLLSFGKIKTCLQASQYTLFTFINNYYNYIYELFFFSFIFRLPVSIESR